MSKFINTVKKNTVTELTSNVKNILNNPYYLYNDKKPSIAQYYNINSTRTTLDEAARTPNAKIGLDSPVRYNLIKDMFLYGVQKMELQLDMGENGLESGGIAGEAIILPNTIVPYVGDFFTLDQIGKPYLFEVREVQQNTLDTGSILYKIDYAFAYPDLHGIDGQVVAKYNFIIDNVGTNYNTVIRDSKYNLIEKIEQTTVKLKDYYNNIFYKDKVQTYVYLYDDLIRVYDPYLIEFMIRNKIMKGATVYTFVTQQIVLPSMFGVNYDKTIFAALENHQIRDGLRTGGNFIKILEPLSLLYAYPEDYYKMEYDLVSNKFYYIDIFKGWSTNIADNIRNNSQTGNILFDIMIKYFNNIMITDEDIDKIYSIDYHDNITLYYGIPIVIFCLESIITNLLNREVNANGKN